MASNINIRINAKDNASAVLRRVGNMMPSIATLAKVAAAATVGAIGAGAKLFATQEKAEIKLASVIKATGGAAGLSAQEMMENAKALQSMTTFGDEAIINTQALLATFKNIKGDEFSQATKAIADMSLVMDQDLKSSAVQVGKALNDPLTGLSALSRVGVTFSESQKEMVKSMVASGDVMGAQKIILAELESQFGGAAEAARNSFGGSMIALKNVAGDALEGIGSIVAEVFKSFGSGEGMIERLSGVADMLRNNAVLAATFIREMLAPAIQFVSGLIQQFKDFLIENKDAVMLMGMAAVMAFDGIITTVQLLWIAVKTAMKNIFDVTSIVISNVVQGWMWFFENFKTIMSNLPKIALIQMQAVGGIIAGVIKKILSRDFSEIGNVVRQSVQNANQELNNLGITDLEIENPFAAMAQNGREAVEDLAKININASGSIADAWKKGVAAQELADKEKNKKIIQDAVDTQTGLIAISKKASSLIEAGTSGVVGLLAGRGGVGADAVPVTNQPSDMQGEKLSNMEFSLASIDRTLKTIKAV